MPWLRGAIPAIFVLCWAFLPSCGSGFSSGGAPNQQKDGNGPDASSAGGDGSGGSSGSGGRSAGSGGVRPDAGGGAGKGSGGRGVAGAESGGAPAGGQGGHPTGGGAGGVRPSSGGTGAGGRVTVPEAGMDAAPPSPDIPPDALVLWLRADRGVTVKSGLVTSWADQSLTGALATQDQDDLKPVLVSNDLNGQPSIQFEDDFLQLGSGFSDFSSGLTMFSVATQTDTPGCMGIFEASNGGEINDISFDSDFGKFNYEVQDENYEDVLYPQDLAQLFSVVHHTDGSVIIDRNGLFGQSAQMMLPEVILRKAVYVGRTLYGNCGYYHGRISEIILYSRALSDAEVRTVDTYLQKKYGCCSPTSSP